MKKDCLWKRIYGMLNQRQKLNFIIIIGIMIVSAILSQLLPISIGTLTDDILNQSQLSFTSILPFLFFILLITIAVSSLSIYSFSISLLSSTITNL